MRNVHATEALGARRPWGCGGRSRRRRSGREAPCCGSPRRSIGLPPRRQSGRVLLFGFLLLVAVIFPAAAQAAPARILRVERYASEEAARIVLHLSRPVTFQAGALDSATGSAKRLHVDVSEAGYSGPHSFEMDGLVERLRVQRVGSTHRLMLDLSERGRLAVFYLPEPFRIVIDVSRAGSPVTAKPLGRAVHRLALDPGHGGSDSGATGRGGLREKDIVLDIAHRAAPLLARELGIATLLTRDSDARVPLEERVARANAFGADLFISIHCNADPSRSARGVMSFVLGGSHDHRAASHILERENSSEKNAKAVDLRHFLGQFDDTDLVAGSAVFARLLQRAALASLAAGYPDAVDGGVHGAGFYVLAGARMPAVLFETSFVSNALEERHLGTARYRQKLADAIVNAVRAYREGYPRAAP